MDIHARIGYDGQEIYAFTFPWTGSLPEAVTLTGNVLPTDRDRAVAESWESAKRMGSWKSGSFPSRQHAHLR